MKAGLALVEGWGWKCRFYSRNVCLELSDFRSANDNESRICKHIKNDDWFYSRSFSKFIWNDWGYSRKILTLNGVCVVIQTQYFSSTISRIIITTTAPTITLLKAMQIRPIDQTLHTSRSVPYVPPFSRVASHSAHTHTHTHTLVALTFWRRNYFFLNFSTPVYKMWIIQEPNTLDLWNKLHFEEEKTESIYHV